VTSREEIDKRSGLAGAACMRSAGSRSRPPWSSTPLRREDSRAPCSSERVCRAGSPSWSGFARIGSRSIRRRGAGVRPKRSWCAW